VHCGEINNIDNSNVLICKSHGFFDGNAIITISTTKSLFAIGPFECVGVEVFRHIMISLQVILIVIDILSPMAVRPQNQSKGSSNN